MKIAQYRYLSPEARALRKRDGVPPWGVHPCEVAALAGMEPNQTAFYAQWLAAVEMRRQLETT
jgi:hypothetical protein